MNRNITAIILIIISVGLYLTITTKMLADVKLVQADNKNYISAMEKANELINIKKKRLEEYNNLTQEDRSNLDKMIPKSVDNIRLIIDLNSFAEKNGLILKNIKAVVSSKADDKSPKNIPATVSAPVIGGGAVDTSLTSSIIPIPVLDSVIVSFNVTAPYLRFISFLQELESNLRIMDLTKLSVKVNDSGVYEWSVEVKTYWLRSQ